MKSDQRLKFLQESHAYLDKQIAEVYRSRSFEDLELVKLKKEKLRLKDAIRHLQHSTERVD